MTHLVPEDWDPDMRLVSSTAAARTVDRPVGTIYRWASLGLLTPYIKIAGRPYYLESHVHAVDTTMRDTNTGD